jgi:hypothetical protein
MKKTITLLLVIIILSMSLSLYNSLKGADYYGLINEIFNPVEEQKIHKIKIRKINWKKEIQFTECKLYDKNKKYFDSIEVKLLTDKIIED